jgi:hypothetical protein
VEAQAVATAAVKGVVVQAVVQAVLKVAAETVVVPVANG